MGNNTEFQSAVVWLSENLTLVDARVNLVECNIRVLGGLVSGHLLATDSTDRLGEGGFVCKKDIRLPINAKFRGSYGVMENETTETSTSGCGIQLRLAFFLKRGSSGECFILLILLCGNISDMVQEHIHHPQQTSRTKVALTFMNGSPSSQQISPSSQSPFRKASSS
ncbi:hypothetical protein L3X38_026444 [Prunus dulcis]|uniref:Uncharacterized protein n=1 Tax=Prunus dulcis TaxID=3755 RepID=A0AAD4VL84_PRUDU|nr:hypothetical protein L3X38_026444 [Prunus dulcis]